MIYIGVFIAGAMCGALLMCLVAAAGHFEESYYNHHIMAEQDRLTMAGNELIEELNEMNQNEEISYGTYWRLYDIIDKWGI